MKTDKLQPHTTGRKQVKGIQDPKVRRVAFCEEPDWEVVWGLAGVSHVLGLHLAGGY